MAKAKKTLADANIEAENEVFSDQPKSEVADSNDSFGDLGPVRRHHWIALGLIFVLVVVAVFVGFGMVYAGKIYPGVSVNGIAVGGMSQTSAKQALAQGVKEYQQQQVPIEYGNTTLAVDVSQINTSYDLDQSITDAYAHGRRGSIADHLRQIARAVVGRPTRLSQFNYDDDKLAPYIQQIVEKTDSPVANAGLSFSDTGRVSVTSDISGQRLDIGLLVRLLEQRIAAGSADPITAPVYSLAPVIPKSSLEAAKVQADNYLQSPVTITIQGKDHIVAVADIIKWITVNKDMPTGLSPQLTLDSVTPRPISSNAVTLGLDDAGITGYVAGLAKSIDRVGQNAELSIQNGHATVFQPSVVGYQLDQAATVQSIKDTLTQPADQRSFVAIIKTTNPDVTEANLNDLGINELISEGITYFPGSPPARMQNIRVGASKFNGVLVKPGETFSFESLLGEVGPAEGYAPALVILGDHEEYQYGGGMCQVSSTAYRAALLAGLPIVERHNHSFAVGYYMAPYGVPGVDATVFNASVDLKFLNDTGHYILIQTVVSGTTLKFDFYGTKIKSGSIRGPYFDSPANGSGWNVTIPSTTTFYRDVLDLAGNVTKTDTITTHYKSSLDFPVVKELN